MSKKKVGIIFGGKSAEHEVSLQSAKNIIDAIDRTKYDVVLLGIDKQGRWQLNEASSFLLHAENPALIQLNQSSYGVAMVPGRSSEQFVATQSGDPLDQLDVIFPIVHGTLGEDGSLQGLLRMANLPYVGPNVLSSAICMDKDIAKRLLQAADLPVARGLSFTKARQDAIDFTTVKETLGLPVFIKPANQGSSVGVSKATCEESFFKAVEDAFQYDTKIVVEEEIIGREIEVAVLGNEHPEASLPGEILPQSGFYSYESKYIDDEGARLELPASLAEKEVKDIQKLALDAFQTLQCEGLARVDFFLKPDGQWVINEVNTLPGFTQISMYPKLWEISGLSYTALIDQLLELAIERYERETQLKSSIY
ncbi:D-alanine--D-alanine ligase [Bacillaceae bacterium SIJ1]|uniref:D-alanine--D-alanine ligase n=1 Tax=Litoribacterium kuwaitense TaxID=1398745 RepID=UPI0013EB2FBA|nr:D-alanine--D-alanine ligase [Litoribacterium kuwaitense]NGP45918.1 D-alanine--D-alanine ligase [Litoribacterium kuwaitense]